MIKTAILINIIIKFVGSTKSKILKNIKVIVLK